MSRYIMYCRKSSEAEDRQVLSIESQINELKNLAQRLNFNVIDIMTESYSAKGPGRSVFNQMIKNIQQNKADGVICWKLDRLARNPIDGGQITWMLQQGIIKHLRTFDRDYYPQDNVLLMNVEFGMANQYVLDLSRNVKRGLKAKAEKGWRPNYAPIGYLNDKSKGKGKNEIIKDPDRFHLVKRMWNLMVTSRHSPLNILDIANNKWGFRTAHGKLLSRSSMYRIFSNSFYCGLFEYPVGSGNWYQGSHESMITQSDYDKVQILLGRKGRPRPKKHNFPFTGLIRCGQCGATVTAEKKNQIICSVCKKKFSSNNKWQCPKCNTPINKMENPNILNYVYYHCIKKRKPKCSQGSIEIKELEKQIEHKLSKIQISESFKNWAIDYLKELNKKETVTRDKIITSQRKAYNTCLKRLDNLFTLKISPLNTDGNLLSDEEYAKRKTELVKEKARLEEILNDTGNRVNKWMNDAEEIFNFACNARKWFLKGNSEEKSRILQTIGSNLTLKDKILHIQLKIPLFYIESVSDRLPQIKIGFEPKKTGQNERKLGQFYSESPILRGVVDDVRTYFQRTNEFFDLPFSNHQ